MSVSLVYIFLIKIRNICVVVVIDTKSGCFIHASCITQQPDKCNVFGFLMGVINFCGRVLADSIHRENKKNVLYNVPIFVSAHAIEALQL